MFDSETLHHLALSFLRVWRWWPPAPALPALQQRVFGITFKNPVGLAGGFDKNGVVIPGLEALGFGFIEVGSVTALPQEGNPRPRIFRRASEGAIVNRMGMNNEGARALAERLSRVRRSVPIGISLGKSKVVALENAAADYRASFEALYPHGDYFVVNVSSPNTPGLRDLQDKKYLSDILLALGSFRRTQDKHKPILVKIAPELTNEALDDVLLVCREQGVDGLIATNTIATPEGGLSGKPLRERSTEVIRYIHQKAPELPIIGVGGIFTAEDAYEKIKAGASLVQIYTGFIYGGPFAARTISRGLARLLEQDGFKNITEAIGVGK